MGSSFYGCLNYCLEDKKPEHCGEVAFKNRAEVLMYHQCFGNKEELAGQFEEVRSLNKKVASPVLHIALSLAPGEQLDRGKLIDMVDACARNMGFDKNQYVAIQHIDTGHQHLHIVANRVGFDGKTVSDSGNYRKIAAFCREMEQKYELRPVLSPRKFLPPEQRQMPRLDKRKEELKGSIEACLALSAGFAEFEQNMRRRGYEVRKGKGISFFDSKAVKVKGSEVGYPLWKVEKILDQQARKKEQSLFQRPVQSKNIEKQEPQMEIKPSGRLRL